LPEPQLLHWVAFGVVVFVLLVLDLTVFHRKSHEPALRESLGWTIFWCSLSLAFNGLIWYWLGHKAAVAFLLGYAVEWSLSMDNVFVFLLIFTYFGVPLKYQYRVLFWGILGAVVMRLTFVTVAATLIHQFGWIMWLFGAFLVYTGIKLAMHHDQEVHPEKNVLIRWTRGVFRVSREMHGEKFLAREGGRWTITPLFLVLVAIESTDVLFAIDSVPAIFGTVDGWLTTDHSAFTFIVFTSNVCAILGLRALYFLLAGIMGMFRFLSYGLSAVLVFIGVKMVVDYWLPGPLGLEEGEHVVPPVASLVTIFCLLAVSILASVIVDRLGGGTGPSQDESAGNAANDPPVG